MAVQCSICLSLFSMARALRTFDFYGSEAKIGGLRWMLRLLYRFSEVTMLVCSLSIFGAMMKREDYVVNWSLPLMIAASAVATYTVIRCTAQKDGLDVGFW